MVLFFFVFVFFFIVSSNIFSQANNLDRQEMIKEEPKEEKVIQTFRHTRVINSHSVETLPARKLDFRIAHRFGDVAGGAGGWPTFFMV